jgi:FkbM family methyltransferase
MSMSISSMVRRYKTRGSRREYRQMVRRWYADGGDDKFRFNYPLERDALVLDLGGYEGQWASDLYARRPCRIVVFEPVTAFAAKIAARFAHNRDIEVVSCGLGASSRTETIHICGASSSAYKEKAAAEIVQIVDVKTWLEDNDVRSVQLMKINIEGGEFELLERLLETGLIAGIDDIQVQFHNFAPNASARMEAIQRGLAKTHVPTYQYRFVWENWTRKPG